MKTNTVILTGLALAVSALTTIAQPGPGDGPPRRRGGPPAGAEGEMQRPPPLPPFMAALDADKNHILSAQEIADAPAALLTLDKNKDGRLTPEEYLPARRGPRGEGLPPTGTGPRGRGPGGPPATGTDQAGERPARPPQPPVIAALDANHDGVIDVQEIANAPAALLKLDKNHDGQLTPDEIRPSWAGPRGPGGPGGPQGPRGPRPPRPQGEGTDAPPPVNN